MGYRPQVGNLDCEGRVAPKIACVQDIRPHVPELGCTSAVQNEKMYFSFLYCCAARLAREPLKQGATGGRRLGLTIKARCLDLQEYMNTTNKSIASQRYRTPSWQCRGGDASPPELACVQDIRPHVPELGCTSAVQNEKMYFSFCTAECSPWHVPNLNTKADREPRRHYPNQARCLALQIHEYHE